MSAEIDAAAETLLNKARMQGYADLTDTDAEVLVRAALPAIREAIAQDIEAACVGMWQDNPGLAKAAHIVRGGAA